MQSHIHVTTTHSKSTNNPAVAQNGNALPGALNPSPPDRTPQVRFAERPPLKVASSNRNDPWMARYDSAFQTHVPLLATATERGQRSGSASERVHRRIRCFIIVRIVVYAVGTLGPRVGSLSSGRPPIDIREIEFAMYALPTAGSRTVESLRWSE